MKQNAEGKQFKGKKMQMKWLVYETSITNKIIKMMKATYIFYRDMPDSIWLVLASKIRKETAVSRRK